MRKGSHHTEESKRKNSESRKGKCLGNSNPSKRPEVRAKLHKPKTEEHKRKISIALTGKERSEEHCLHLSISMKEKWSNEPPPRLGKHCSEETKLKISNANKGRIPTEEERRKISYANRGRKHSLETRQLLSKQRTGAGNPMYGKTREYCPSWQGGISFEPYCPKWTPELRERIRAFFNYECILCGKSQEENITNTKTVRIWALDCHHVEYNKQACCDGKEVHFAALCRSCHGKTNHERDKWEEILHRIIDEIYNGRSYYTKEEYRKLINK